jgi:hypothetical protein
VGLWPLACRDPAESMDVSPVSVVCYQVEVPTTDWSFVLRNPTECGGSECNSEASIMRRPRAEAPEDVEGLSIWRNRKVLISPLSQQQQTISLQLNTQVVRPPC